MPPFIRPRLSLPVSPMQRQPAAAAADLLITAAIRSRNTRSAVPPRHLAHSNRPRSAPFIRAAHVTRRATRYFDANIATAMRISPSI